MQLGSFDQSTLQFPSRPIVSLFGTTVIENRTDSANDKRSRLAAPPDSSQGSGRWVAATSCLLLTNGDDQRPVHREGVHRGPTRRRQRHDPFTLPPEVFHPGLRPWVEQGHFLPG